MLSKQKAEKAEKNGIFFCGQMVALGRKRVRDRAKRSQDSDEGKLGFGRTLTRADGRSSV